MYKGDHMKEELKNELLEKGNITLSDYNKFIEMEGLNFSYEKEGEL